MPTPQQQCNRKTEPFYRITYYGSRYSSYKTGCSPKVNYASVNDALQRIEFFEKRVQKNLTIEFQSDQVTVVMTPKGEVYTINKKERIEK